MTTTTTHDAALAALAKRLLVPGDRIGWEYVEPDPAMRSSTVAPSWFEPISPDVRALQMQGSAAGRRMIWAGPVGGLIAFSGLVSIATSAGWLFLLIGLGIVATSLVPMMTANQKISEAQGAAAARRAHQWAAFQQAHAQHVALVEQHDRAEQQRVDTAMRWFPLQVRPGDRLDVFGGSGEARSALLATLGCSMLAAQKRVTVVDLTDEGIATPLATLASAARVPVVVTSLPADLSNLDVLAGFDATDAAEMLAEAIHPRRRGDGHDDTRDDSRDLGADLIGAVLARLEARPSLARLVGGLKALDSSYDPATDGALSQSEFTALTTTAHDLVAGERSREELRVLIRRLALLTAPGTTSGSAFQPLSGVGLSVLSTATAGNQRRKELLDRVLGSMLLHAVDRARGRRDEAVLVVAGADLLGTVVLESLARAATLASVRLVYVFDHLRDDTRPLLGGPNSTAVVMRLGNKDEATEAADFIGQETRFVLGQVSRQTGRTATVGGGTSYNEGTNSSETRGTQHGHGGYGSNRSQTTGTSQSHGVNDTWSIADSYTDGQVDTRVREYTVEPTTIQSLPPTAFVLVDATAGQRHVVMGNCDPRITELDRVAGRPR